MNTQILPLIDELSAHEGLLPLSYSKIRLLLACPRQFKARYLDKSEGGIPMDKESAVVGKFVHAVLQYCLDRGQNFGYDTQTVDFDLTWQQVSKQVGLTLKEYEMAQAMRVNAENVLERILTAVNARNLSVQTEAQMVMQLDGSVKGNARWEKRFLFGYMDFIGLTPSKTRALVLDYKTHQYSDESSDEARLQTALYAFMLFLRYPELQAVQTGCAYIPDENIDLCAEYRRDSPHALISMVRDFLQEFLDTYRSTDFSPIKSKFCDWCSYIGSCPLHKRKKTKKPLNK